VQGFDNHVSAVVPWLRETGIADHIRSLSKDEIRTATAVPPPGDVTELRVIVEAMESLLRDAHRLCFDGLGLLGLGVHWLSSKASLPLHLIRYATKCGPLFRRRGLFQRGGIPVLTFL
jgi:hypothetical protein